MSQSTNEHQHTQDQLIHSVHIVFASSNQLLYNTKPILWIRDTFRGFVSNHIPQCAYNHNRSKRQSYTSRAFIIWHSQTDFEKLQNFSISKESANKRLKYVCKLLLVPIIPNMSLRCKVNTFFGLDQTYCRKNAFLW